MMVVMWWRKNRIYMDYAAATPVCAVAQKEYASASRVVGNSGAIHASGVAARFVVEGARADVAGFLSCRSREIIFTSGGTESNNLAIIGYANSLGKRGKELSDTHWVAGAIEHPSVLACFAELERRGAKVDYVSPDARGIIRPEALASALQPNTVLVSIGWANGEIGVVQPLRALAKTIAEYSGQTTVNAADIVFHTDAGQAPLYLATTAAGLGVDMLTLDSGKCYGPKGIGALFVRDAVTLAPIMFGGGQERGLRSGSEAYALAASFASALTWVGEVRERETARLATLRAQFTRELTRAFPDAVINGNKKNTLPHIVNVSLPRINSEYITLSLDHKGISISTKSSCREGEEDESHVVRALGGASWRAKNTLRFSFGAQTTARGTKRALNALIGSVLQCRKQHEQ